MPRAPRRPSGEARRGAYKPGVDFAWSRRRREDRLLVLRCRNRDAGLFKRRRDEPTPATIATPSEAAAPATAGTTSSPSSRPSSPPSSSPTAAAPRTATDSEFDGLSEMVDKACSDDTTSQLEATVQFRKLLSDEKNSTVIKIIRADVLPRWRQHGCLPT